MTRTPDSILLAHGGGGRIARSLIEEIIQKYFSNKWLDLLSDAALLQVPGGQVAFTTDSFVVQPLFFPGGDIGKLSVCGTVNDLAVMGARPLALSCGLIIEEGFSVAALEKILQSMKTMLDLAGVPVVAGDTKVVERGAAHGLFINTAGIGMVQTPAPSGPDSIQPGDAILINGSVGDHGVAVMACRQGLKFESDIRSDCAPLNGLVQTLLEAAPGTRFMRDATRGGVAAVLNEMCAGRAWGSLLEERAIPVNPGVAALCDLLGVLVSCASNH